jgi:hypothetical protein
MAYDIERIRKKERPPPHAQSIHMIFMRASQNARQMTGMAENAYSTTGKYVEERLRKYKGPNFAEM